MKNFTQSARTKLVQKGMKNSARTAVIVEKNSAYPAGGDLVDGDSFGEEVFYVLRLDAGHDHAGPALPPVHRGRYLQHHTISPKNGSKPVAIIRPSL